MNRAIVMVLIGLAVAWGIGRTALNTLAIFGLEVAIWWLARYLKQLADNLPKD